MAKSRCVTQANAPLHPRNCLVALILVPLCLALASCRSTENAGAGDAGAPASTGDVPGIVTRIVERITIVTRTPDPVVLTEEARQPVVLDISLEGELQDLDPGMADLPSQHDLSQNLFAGLTNFNPDTHVVEPELATSWTVSEDGQTWTFNLRDDIFWVKAGGKRPGSAELWSTTPVRRVTAEDIVYAIQRHCNREAQSPTAYSLFIIEGCKDVFSSLDPAEVSPDLIGIEAIDSSTLSVRLTRPAGYFLTLTSMPFFQPVPRDLVEELGYEWLDPIGEYSTGWQTPDNLITSGPYFPVPNEFTSQRVVLHRNPLWPLTQTGNVDIININYLEDDMDSFELWQDRALDIAPLPITEREAFIERSPEKVRSIPEPVFFYIGFDFGSQVFREPEVRRAFSAAIDRQRLVDELYDGRAIVMRHVTIPGFVGAIPVNEVGVGYSPDYARQQMAASTFRSCALLPEVTFLVSSADLSLRQAELLRNMWIEELNCLKESIHIEQAQFGELLARTRQDSSGRPDMWELAWAPTFPDTQNILGSLIHCQEGENRQNRECSEADDRLRQAAITMDPSERTELYRQA